MGYEGRELSGEGFVDAPHRHVQHIRELILQQLRIRHRDGVLLRIGQGAGEHRGFRPLGSQLRGGDQAADAGADHDHVLGGSGAGGHWSLLVAPMTLRAGRAASQRPHPVQIFCALPFRPRG